MGTTGFSVVFGGKRRFAGRHAKGGGRVGSGVCWKALDCTGDGEVFGIRGDNVEVAVGAATADAGDGDGIRIDFLSKEDKRCIVGTVVGGGDDGEFLVGKLGEDVGHLGWVDGRRSTWSRNFVVARGSAGVGEVLRGDVGGRATRTVGLGRLLVPVVRR
jgi:hypothetical protein